MASFYDSVGSFGFQVGTDLQTGSSRGWSSGQSIPWETGLDQQISICVHQGLIHVAYLQLVDDGTTVNILGPFVKKYDYTTETWVAVGGEVEPANVHNSYGLGAGGTGTLGDKFHPSNPTIKSDGTDLYVSYSMRVEEAAPNVPQVGSYVFQGEGPGDNSDPYGVVTTSSDHLLWWPRHAYVRKWSGSSWDLYGEITPICFNSHVGSNINDNQNGFFGGPYMEVSPAEPGKVYMAVTEQGMRCSVYHWRQGASFFGGLVFGTDTYGGWARRTCVGQFDGSSLYGTLKEIVPQYIQEPNTDFFGIQDPAVTGHPGYILPVVKNNGGMPMIFWIETYPTIRMDYWVSLGTLQTLAIPGDEQVYPFEVVHDPVQGVYLYVASTGFNRLFQVKDDGSAPWQLFENDPDTVSGGIGVGISVPSVTGSDAWGARVILPESDHGNFFLSTINGPVANDQHVLHYRRNCTPVIGGHKKWLDVGYISDSSTSDRVAGSSPMALGTDPFHVGGTTPYLFLAAYVYNGSNSALDMKVRVYGHPITRNAGSCGGPLVVTSTVTNAACGVATLNGTINPQTSLNDADVYFEWGTTTSYGNTVDLGNFNGFSTLLVSTGITGLTGGTTYHYRLSSRTSGVITSGSDMSFVEGVCPKVAIWPAPDDSPGQYAVILRVRQ